MTIAAIIALIPGFFAFFTQVQWLIKLLQATPAEQRDSLIKTMQQEADNFKKTGRPTWG